MTRNKGDDRTFVPLSEGRNSSLARAGERWTWPGAVLLAALIATAGGASTPVNGAAKATGSLTKTGSLSTSRAFFTATVLEGGKVLIAGGLQADLNQAQSLLASAELYDPATGKWARTGALGTARYGHTATLLDSGKVLVVGGKTGAAQAASASSELYDPETGIWTSSASLEVPRFGHTATLLKNGRVLVVGGIREEGGDPVASAAAEIYDAANDTWVTTAALPTARQRHTSTLLESGHVLVVGGEQDSAGVASSGSAYAPPAVYNPVTATWTMASGSGGRRSRHTATRLKDGSVLVAGGLTFPGVGANASADISGRTPTVELYNAPADTWSVADPLPFTPVFQEATTLRRGNVLLVGLEAYKPGDTPKVHVQIYDVTTRAWTQVAADITVTAFAPSVSVLENGNVLMTAGDSKAAYVYNLPEVRRGRWAGAAVAAAAVLMVAVIIVFLARRRRSKETSRAGGGFASRGPVAR